MADRKEEKSQYRAEYYANNREEILRKAAEYHANKVVAKGDAREVGDRELELFQICQSTSLPGLSVNFFR